MFTAIKLIFPLHLHYMFVANTMTRNWYKINVLVAFISM